MHPSLYPDRGDHPVVHAVEGVWRWAERHWEIVNEIQGNGALSPVLQRVSRQRPGWGLWTSERVLSVLVVVTPRQWQRDRPGPSDRAVWILQLRSLNLKLGCI